MTAFTYSNEQLVSMAATSTSYWYGRGQRQRQYDQLLEVVNNEGRLTGDLEFAARVLQGYYDLHNNGGINTHIYAQLDESFGVYQNSLVCYGQLDIEGSFEILNMLSALAIEPAYEAYPGLEGTSYVEDLYEELIDALLTWLAPQLARLSSQLVAA